MAPRAYWKGYLKLSLVSCPIQLFPAISEREKIRFHQINRKTGNRIKYCKVDAATGKPVSDDDIVKGYEVGKGLVSRVTPVQTVMRNCTRDEGRSFEFGNQVLISSHRKLLSSKDTMG